MQSQFLSSGLHGEGKWIVPITLFLGSYNRRKNFLLESKFEKVDVSELFSSSDGYSGSFNEANEEKCSEFVWVKVNVEQSGFYRVKYEDKLAAQLRKAVEKNCLLATDKFGVLDDAFALCQACEISISSLLSLMNVYRKELDYAVLSKLIDVCYSVVEISIDAIPDAVNELKTFFINLLLFSAEKLGWESVPGEIHLNTMLRGEVYKALATFGHDKTHSEAMQRFESLLDDRATPLLSADTRKAAYIAIMRNASTTNRNGFESLLKILREADTVHEKERVLGCIASCPDSEIVLEVLNLLVSDEVRDQDIIYGLGGISLEGREIAWRWLKENWDLILNKYGDGLLITHFIRDIITPFCSNEKADEVTEFFATRATPGIAMNLKQSIEQVRIKARWVQSIKQESSLEEVISRLAC